jgi:Svf1-like protein
MHHAFWPTCKVVGSVLTPTGEVKLDGRGKFIHALQGMKPHHAAARWNFVNFQSPSYTAVMMEYTTPPSYASTVVNVGGIVDAVKGEILFAGSDSTCEHSEIKGDEEVDWPEPAAVTYKWHGKTAEGKEASATLAGPLGERLDRVDIMGELPGFVKAIASTAAGTRPYIYQVNLISIQIILWN